MPVSKGEIMNATGIISGLLTGLILGWALQRGGFCMNIAFRSIVYKEDRSSLQAWVLILLINIPAITLLENLGFIFPERAPFRPFSLMIGALIFGMGMVWAGGCVSGTYYRASKGMLGSLFAFFGFLFGLLMTRRGVLDSLRQVLNRFEWTIAGEIPHLGYILPFDPMLGSWIVVMLLLISGVIYLIKAEGNPYSVGWKWPVTGTVVGLAALAAWIFSSLEGRNYGLSIIQPTTVWGSWLLFGDSSGLNWTAWMLIALPPGAFLAAWRGKDLSFRLPEPKRAFIQFIGGLIMGIGAALAGGCNFGHSITGMSALALSSLAATIFSMFGNWIATSLVWRVSRNSFSGLAGNLT